MSSSAGISVSGIATRTERGTPRSLVTRPNCSSLTTMPWTDGGVTRKYSTMSSSAGPRRCNLRYRRPRREAPFRHPPHELWDVHWAIHPVSASVLLDGLDIFHAEYGVWRPVYKQHRLPRSEDGAGAR